ncbi:MAG: sn-glycerol-3-phosphate ABC transporter ATP-binding protein UgpC [Phycisphaerales bacterium]|jgi:ABC-type sugar transport system ATPase subunit
MSTLTLENVSKVYPNGVAAVEGVSFDVSSGGFCVLLGPSGCGKSTTLRMVAGLESISGGTIRIDGKVVNNVHPKDRDIAMVFQNYALYPHLTVAANIAFPLAMRGVPKRDIEPRVAQAAAMLELSELLHRRPAQLSGGQRQRVALARAIVREPKVFLFDEPLSNLDARMRHHTRAELKTLHSRLKVTSLYVTHDQEEAMSLADVLVVMAGGRVRQVGSPMDVFEAPADRFVASFIGSPPMNFLDGVVSPGPRGNMVVRLVVAGVAGPVVAALAADATPRAGANVVVGVRPSACRLADDGEAAALRGAVTSIELLGEVMDVTIDCGGKAVVARVASQRGMQVGEVVNVGFDLAKVHVFEPGASGRRLASAAVETAAAGERAAVPV